MLYYISCWLLVAVEALVAADLRDGAEAVEEDAQPRVYYYYY